MSHYLITAIRHDDRGDISHVMWGQVNPADPARWTVEPKPADVDDVIAALDGGDYVQVRAPEGTLGRVVRRKILTNGRETIQSADAELGAESQLPLERLPTF